MFPFFNHYPGTDLHEIDLAYILKLCAELKASNTTLTEWKASHEREYDDLRNDVDGLINNLVDVISPWDSSIAYHVFSIVEYQGTNYIAVQDVPVGAMITNTDYWQPANTALEQINAIGQVVNDASEKVDALNFDTVATMKVADLTLGTITKTSGYYAINDGGGASYYIAASEIASEWCEALDNGLYAVLIHPVAFFNIKQCGAVPDNTTDCTTIIQSVIDKIYLENPNTALSQGQMFGGGTVYIPAGRYVCEAIDISDKCNLVIKGDGRYLSFIKSASQTRENNFLSGTFSYTRFANVRIEGINMRAYNRAVNILYGVSCSIVNCGFHGNNVGVYNDKGVNNRVENSLFFMCDNGIEFVNTAGTGNLTSAWIKNCHFQTCGIGFYSHCNAVDHLGARTVYFEDNIVEFSTTVGIDIISGSNTDAEFYIMNNHIEQNNVRLTRAGVIFEGNDTDSQLVIQSPIAGRFIKVRDIDLLSQIIYNGYDNLFIDAEDRTGAVLDTIHRRFVIIGISTVGLASYPHSTTDTTYYTIKYSSSNGIHNSIGSRALNAAYTIAGSDKVGIADPAVNAGGTVAFSDSSGTNKMLEINYNYS